MSESGGNDWDWGVIRKRCKREALRILRRDHDAEEVTQEALARAWRSRASCRTPEAPVPWCLQITRNEALRLMSRRRGSPESAWAFEDEIEIDDRRARREAERTVVRVDVSRAVDQLTPQEQTLIAMRYVEDCSHPEIAARLQIPEATARVRLHRAHKRLRSLLDA